METGRSSESQFTRLGWQPKIGIPADARIKFGLVTLNGSSPQTSFLGSVQIR